MLMFCFANNFAYGVARTLTTSNKDKQNTTLSKRSITNRSGTTNTTTNTKSLSSRLKNKTTVRLSSSRLLPNTSQNKKQVISRTAKNTTQISTNTFDTEYNDCRDAYFTCMDQFCANQNEEYRRCICSARLTEIQTKQNALMTADESIQDFKNTTLTMVSKTSDEVSAMMSASTGEQKLSKITDKSQSANTLSGINSILSSAKQTTFNSGIATDIDAIWATTNFTGSSNIANLTGENLYNAVHAQCVQMVEPMCPDTQTINLITSAYGMYIENDCSSLANNLNKNKATTHTNIQSTKKELSTARLENYNAHNSLGINDCIASVRQDLTAPTACGPDYVHCLDITGQYLNIETGEPIYTPKFYQLGNQLSLSGNILTNKYNKALIAELNKKQIFAQNTLDTCRDLSENVWDEFIRQAVIEIYQGQQERIRKVKQECLDVVNKCYDEQLGKIKDFSTVDEPQLIGLRLETVEDLCTTQLTTCSNLYGNGSNGMQELLNAMHNITDKKIASECQNLLTTYAQDICAVSQYDTVHSAPYACRTMPPGEQQYATIPNCNSGQDLSLCGSDYSGSLYQKLAQYASQMCVRSSEYLNNAYSLSNNILQDITTVLNNVKISMSDELSKECSNQGGIWFSTPYITNTTSAKLHDGFYANTGSNKQWGYCADANQTYTITLITDLTSGAYDRVSQTNSEKLSNINIPTKKYKDNYYYAFMGYYTAPQGAGLQIFNKNGIATNIDYVTTDTILYANWKKCRHMDLDKGINTTTYPNGIETKPTQQYYMVYGEGWYADDHCTTPINYMSTIPTAQAASNGPYLNFLGYVAWIGPAWEDGGHDGNYVISSGGAFITTNEALTAFDLGKTAEEDENDPNSNWEPYFFSRWQ